MDPSSPMTKGLAEFIQWTVSNKRGCKDMSISGCATEGQTWVASTHAVTETSRFLARHEMTKRGDRLIRRMFMAMVAFRRSPLAGLVTEVMMSPELATTVAEAKQMAKLDFDGRRSRREKEPMRRVRVCCYAC
ncbi:hypothetical protein L2E82_02503 [Cichorium intybus]|uniref:Uncharacterized protein n=1 Tax=Cichorium intybus TaxID=13427 RepID=A0ACB9H2X9_CICIN|nr:hypothetical protein L2E82_02503 [Cichorium intybus]